MLGMLGTAAMRWFVGGRWAIDVKAGVAGSWKRGEKDKVGVGRGWIGEG